MMPSWYSSLSLQLIIGMEGGRTCAILGRAEDNSRHLKHRRLVGSEQSTNEQLRGTRDRDCKPRLLQPIEDQNIPSPYEYLTTTSNTTSSI